MGAKVSGEMLKARKMIEAGATPYGAAKACGVSISAITRSPWYIEFKRAKEAEASASVAPEASAMDRARELVVGSGKTAYAASKLTGVSQSSISRASWYRAHIDSLVDSFKPGGRYGPKTTV